MATRPLVADEATIVNMINAFSRCQNECRRTEAGVNGALGMLNANWTSDRASVTFVNSVTAWLSGFSKVQKGLEMLGTTMVGYSKLTATTEDDNALQAAGWADGVMPASQHRRIPGVGGYQG